MLGEVVGQVVTALLPVDLELFLFHSVTNPVESHVYCLGSLLLDSVVGDALCTLIVGDDDGGWLRVAELF